MARIRTVIQWIKQMNMFKLIDRRTSNDIKEQRISTRIYLSLFAGMILLVY
jgi:hypothetical protein